MSDRPIRIQGAGPAGLSAAIVLARAGRCVQLFERNDSVGKRFSGDLHGVENWSEPTDCRLAFESFGIRTTFDFEPCWHTDLSNGKRTRRINCQRPLFYFVRRGSGQGCLDAGLAEQAESLGVQINYRQSLSNDQADILTNGPDPAEVFAAEKGYLFETDELDRSCGLVCPQAARGGYAYLLSHGGQGVICSVLFDRFDTLGKALDNAMDSFKRLYRFPIHSPKPIGGIGSFSLDRFNKNDGQRLAGEAAGIQDLIFGFGIRSAILSGAIAARSWLDGDNHFQAMQARFGESMRSGIVGRQLWNRYAYPLFNPLTWAVSRCRDPHRLLARMHQPNLLYKAMNMTQRRLNDSADG